MNKIVRIGEVEGGEILSNYFPAIVKWSSDSRAKWQTWMDTGCSVDFRIFLKFCHTDQTHVFDTDTGWWFSYQNYVEIEFEDGTIKTFKIKRGRCLADDKETFRELIEFIDDYVNNGFELTDKTSAVLDEDDLFVV